MCVYMCVHLCVCVVFACTYIMFASACVHLSMCRICGYVCESYVDVCVVFMREYNCEIGCASVYVGVCVYV